jgi:hypothetical protein
MNVDTIIHTIDFLSFTDKIRLLESSKSYELVLKYVNSLNGYWRADLDTKIRILDFAIQRLIH